jgi:hypothetical protein
MNHKDCSPLKQVHIRGVAGCESRNLQRQWHFIAPGFQFVGKYRDILACGELWGNYGLCNLSSYQANLAGLYVYKLMEGDWFRVI